MDNRLTLLFEVLHKKEIFFRFENDEEGFYLSIIDRQHYPRIWADNFQDAPKGIIAESVENVINRTVLAEKDWELRLFGKTIEDLLLELQSFIKELDNIKQP